MKAKSNLQVDIGSMAVDIFVGDSLNNIKSLLSQFPRANGDASLNIRITQGSKRNVLFNREGRILEITGPDIDNLKDPFNTIGIFQAIFRFVGFYSPDNDVFLIHGSAARFMNKTICFGDDGKSVGKTIGSVLCAMESGEYIADEFTFLDRKSGEVFGYPFVPIHLRNIVMKYLGNDLRIPSHKYDVSVAGYFVDPEDLFEFVDGSYLDAFVFIHFVKDSHTLERLSQEDSKKAIEISLLAHQMKFLHPELDRMQFAQQADSDIPKKYEDGLIRRLSNGILQKNVLDRIARNVPCYRALISNPKDIISLLSSLV